VERVLETPLDVNGDIQLVRVTPEQRLNELAFHYPIQHLSSDKLKSVLEKHLDRHFCRMIDILDFSTFRGYIKGYIDLVFEFSGRFYIVDYKSNWLGAELIAYRRQHLDNVMINRSYVFQYLIYSIALHRYLRIRLRDYDYDKHFGGVFYLFLRGMYPNRGGDYGVFRDRPTYALVDALDKLIETDE
jgi:exodeoxyribonuclease V beta subunit